MYDSGNNVHVFSRGKVGIIDGLSEYLVASKEEGIRLYHRTTKGTAPRMGLTKNIVVSPTISRTCGDNTYVTVFQLDLTEGLGRKMPNNMFGDRLVRKAIEMDSQHSDGMAARGHNNTSRTTPDMTQIDFTLLTQRSNDSRLQRRSNAT
jgi:hypothetical protein